jgi:glycerophosphoryl diester phosphodiesterase
VRPILFAHRGGNGPHHDNSDRAFQWALSAGATGWETDVRLSRNGDAILQHDWWIARGFRLSRSRTASSSLLRRLQIMTAEEFARSTLADHPDVPVSVDLKEPGAGRIFTAELARADAAVLDHVYLCSADLDELHALRSDFPTVRIVHSAEARRFSRPLVEHVVVLGAQGVDACNVPVEDWTEDAVEAAHAAGVKVFSSLINQVPRMRRALELGVDGVYTDEVEMMARLFDEHFGTG